LAYQRNSVVVLSARRDRRGELKAKSLDGRSRLAGSNVRLALRHIMKGKQTMTTANRLFHKGKTMRTAILAAIAATCLGLVASSTVSAAPAYGVSIGAAAASLDLRQDAYVYRPYGRYYGYSGYRGYYGYGRYRPCFQTCRGRTG
jgi:hypothetical protein